MVACDMTSRRRNARFRVGRNSLLGVLSAVGSVIAMHGPAQAQQQQWVPLGPQYIQCPAPGQPLLRIPEIVSSGGKLRGTMLLSTVSERMYVGSGPRDSQGRLIRPDPTQCLPQEVRQFRGLVGGQPAPLPTYQGSIPSGYPDYAAPAPDPSPYIDPVPGPTLRAKLGDIVELTFLNQLTVGASWASVDRGETQQGNQGCDQNPSFGYPGVDTFPDCFHGSTTANIHFHGTHTNPGSTGDNVLIEVRPSLRDPDGNPEVSEASVQSVFNQFFTDCERELGKSGLSQWPRSWADLPPAWVATQEKLLKAYDSDPVIISKLWPVDEAQLKAGAWPQYYIGATPYCFRLPEYKPPTSDQSAHPPGHAAALTPAVVREQARALQMGQAPGTHWYHAHKHGSTTIDVGNGMTGAFIIEGPYDEAFNQFYGDGWTRTQPVLVVNQLGVSPIAFGGGNPGGGGLPFSVNGRFQPMITMQPGQVQLWRIVNTSGRGGVYVAGFAPAGPPVPTAPSSPQVFAWKQTAQDGVQFTGENYNNSKNPNLLIAAGNRADLLVQAPTASGQYVLLAAQVRSKCETLPTDLIPTIPTKAPPPPSPPYPSKICKSQPATPLLVVNVTTGQPVTGNQAQFIPADRLQATFPVFLKDIADNEVKGTKTIEFESTPSGGFPPAVHKIDGHQFDGNIGAVVLLNTVEEWKIVNTTVNGALQNGKAVPTTPPGVVDHPFHIHINPFQIAEVFDPNSVVANPKNNNALVPKYVVPGQGTIVNSDVQCALDPNDRTTWRDCHNTPLKQGIWWDTFPIPSARAVFLDGDTRMVAIPGYFRMRSRFVDYTGQYVMHCHILAHEDRGMMTVVEVVPFTTAYSHE